MIFSVLSFHPITAIFVLGRYDLRKKLKECRQIVIRTKKKVENISKFVFGDI
jgi:hypothetical protein